MEITVNVEILCDICDRELDSCQDGNGSILIEPCEWCIDEAREDGLNAR